MRVSIAGRETEPVHLTYCLNVYPGITWPEVQANIERHVLKHKQRFAPDRPFGVGLRLAGEASSEILRGDELARFREYLDAHGLYVFTMNGFPYGPFHGQTVKAEVHAPDWRDDERVAYTLRLIQTLADLLPDGMDGGISTNPFGYHPYIDTTDRAMWQLFVERMVLIAERLHRVRMADGKLIHLDIEPEPDGVLGDCGELIAFYEQWLLPLGVPLLAVRLGLDDDAARAVMLDHIRVCFDTCHVGVSYEDPATILARFAELGIKVGKIQVSSALKLDLGEAGHRQELAAELAQFDEPIYLHQVIQRNADGSLLHYPDLPEALPQIDDPQAEEWRIHFHVPIFVERFEHFGSTQEAIAQTFEVLAQTGFTNHLEIETYTWDVLPAELKQDLDESVAREYQWVLDAIR